MAKYLIHKVTGELFGWTEQWSKMAELMEYNPAVHGVREEVARQMGLKVPPKQKEIVRSVAVTAEMIEPAAEPQPAQETRPAAGDEFADLFEG